MRNITWFLMSQTFQMTYVVSISSRKKGQPGVGMSADAARMSAFATMDSTGCQEPQDYGARGLTSWPLNLDSVGVRLDIGEQALEKFALLVERDIAALHCPIPLHVFYRHGGLDGSHAHLRNIQRIQCLLRDIRDFGAADPDQVAHDSGSKSMRSVAEELAIPTVVHLVRQSHHRENDSLYACQFAQAVGLHLFLNCLFQRRHPERHSLGPFK